MSEQNVYQRTNTPHTNDSKYLNTNDQNEYEWNVNDSSKHDSCRKNYNIYSTFEVYTWETSDEKLIYYEEGEKRWWENWRNGKNSGTSRLVWVRAREKPRVICWTYLEPKCNTKML